MPARRRVVDGYRGGPDRTAERSGDHDSSVSTRPDAALGPGKVDTASRVHRHGGIRIGAKADLRTGLIEWRYGSGDRGGSEVSAKIHGFREHDRIRGTSCVEPAPSNIDCA